MERNFTPEERHFLQNLFEPIPEPPSTTAKAVKDSLSRIHNGTRAFDIMDNMFNDIYERKELEKSIDMLNHSRSSRARDYNYEDYKDIDNKPSFRHVFYLKLLHDDFGNNKDAFVDYLTHMDEERKDELQREINFFIDHYHPSER